MSKELTEQWYNGTLEESMYYVKLPDNDISIVNIYQLKQLALVNDANEIEVLAHVPSYSEYQSLKDNCELTHTRLKGTHQKITQFENKLSYAMERYQERISNFEMIND